MKYANVILGAFMAIGIVFGVLVYILHQALVLIANMV